MQIAVVGAGLAGLAAAAELQRSGHAVTVWEKSRGVGGRTATRRGPDGMRFDHGAPFLHDGAEPLSGPDAVVRHDLVLPDGGSHSEAVATPSANALAKGMASGLDLRFGVRVATVVASGTGWALSGDDGAELGRVDGLVVTAPAPQTHELLRRAAPELAKVAGSVEFAPCWAVMAAWNAPLGLPFTAARDTAGLAWAVAEAPKPGRAPGERWVLHADAALSAVSLESDPQDVAALVLDRFAVVAGSVRVPAPIHVAAHRWRYSRPVSPLAADHLRAGSLAVAGDWCGGATAGAALRSGRAAAAALLE